MVTAVLRPHSDCPLHAQLLQGYVVRTDLDHFLDHCGQLLSLTEEELVTHLLLQGLFVRHDGRDLGTS
jgi:hypothetical protein